MLLASVAYGEPITLRLATVAPDGTAWACEGRAFARDVAADTGGRIELKWYFGAIAGDESVALERIRRGQIDGGALAVACSQLAPTLRVTRLPGIFRSGAEVLYVVGKLRPAIDEELLHAGFINLGEIEFGGTMIFSRAPVRSMVELRTIKIFRWNEDVVGLLGGREMGLHEVPLPLDQAQRAYDAERIDAIYAFPAAALAFQWSAHTRYLTMLPMDYTIGCLIVAARAFDRAQFDDQQILRGAGAKTVARLRDIGREQDRVLVDQLFRRQGVSVMPASQSFQDEFFEEARAARDRLADQVVPRELINRVQQLLSDYRAGYR